LGVISDLGRFARAGFWDRLSGMRVPTTQRVTTPGDVAAVAALAHEIWNQHFPPIIGPEVLEQLN
jgi:hypothetical protein